MTETKTMVKQDVELLDMIEMSEPGNAQRLAYLGRGKIHFVDTLGIWFAYQDGQWKMDGNGIELQALAKLVPRSLFTLAHAIKPQNEEDAAMVEANISWARKSNTEPQLKRMVTLARDLPGVRISHEELDAKPWLFNCQNGTYDFMTNTFRDHDPGDLLTKKAEVWYDPDAKCPNWLGYLDEWQPDKSVQGFLAEISGSAMVGIPVQNLFVNVGSGRNGKGTYYKQIQLILGDYAGTAPEEMLVESRYKVHEEEKARLRGCRFLIAPETAAGDRLDEAGIKNLTGGDIIHGRHLYGRPFDFKPTHTAFLHTNYSPSIRGTDPAIWSRVIKILWEVTIPADRRDMLIDDKLEAERSGILNWMIEGCQRFKRHGVKPPKKVMDWTEEYRQDQDTINRFTQDAFEAMVTDANEVGKVDYIPASILRRHYEAWCLAEGTKPWAAQNVSKELRRLGWEQGQKRVGKVVVKTWNPPTHGYTPTEEHLVTDQTTPTLYPVSLNPYSSVLKNEEEIEINEANERLNSNPRIQDTRTPEEVDEAEREADHRQWLRDHGYPVPPTDEELDEYWNYQEEEPDFEAYLEGE